MSVKSPFLGDFSVEEIELLKKATETAQAEAALIELLRRTFFSDHYALPMTITPITSMTTPIVIIDPREERKNRRLRARSEIPSRN